MERSHITIADGHLTVSLPVGELHFSDNAPPPVKQNPAEKPPKKSC